MILLFWILAFLIPSGLPDSTQGNSDLGLIAADFQILSRITNAIALQAASIQKSVDAQKVVMETLGITPGEFAEIFQINAEKAISVLDNLKNGIEKIAKDNLTSSSDLKQFKESLNVVNSSLQLSSDTSMARIEEIYMNSLRKLKINESLLEYVCEEDEYAVNLQNLVPDEHGQLSRKSDDDRLKILQEFGQKFDGFIKCYTDLVEYGQRIEDLEFWNIRTDYQAARVKGLALPDNLKILKNYTLRLKEDLDLTSSGWKKNQNFEEVFGKQIRNVFKTHWDYMNQLTGPPRTLTAAFFQTTDTRKVFDDLDSVWFKKQIVRGASTQKLKASLKRFGEMSEAVIKLDSKWSSFCDRGLSYEDRDVLQVVSDHLERIETFVKYPGFTEPVDQFVESMSNILTECIQNPDTDFQEKLDKFNQQDTFITKWSGALVSLKSQVNTNMLGIADLRNVTKYVFCLNSLKKNVPSVILLTDVQNIAKSMAADFYECSENKIVLLNLIEPFNVLSGKLNKLRMAMKNFDETSDVIGFTLADVLKKNRGADSLECLRKNNVSVSNLHKIVEFVSSLRDFPNATMIDFATNYLSQIAEIKSEMANTKNTIRDNGSRSKRATSLSSDSSNPVLSLNNSAIHAQRISECTLSLLELEWIRTNRERLAQIGDHFDSKVIKAMEGEGIKDSFLNPKKEIEKLIKQADEINVLAKTLRSQSVRNMSKIFREVANIRGLDGKNRERLWKLKGYLKNNSQYKDVLIEWDGLIHTNMDFTKYSSSLKDGFNTVFALNNYFDRIFGHVKDQEPKTIVVEKPWMSWLVLICSVIGVVSLLFLIILTAYGLTEKGKEKYKNIYLFYFGKPADFEKRWRYARFTDFRDGNNLILDPVKESNAKSLMEAVKIGAYIDAFTKLGNTALHVAAREGKPDIVRILIKNGIDRTLLNIHNKTAEQCMPLYLEEFPDRADKYNQVQRVFKKYQKKKFRKQVPLRFPPHSFRILLVNETDIPLTDAFHKHFSSITSFDLLANTSHCVVKTDANGVFEVERIEQLAIIFHGIIIVKESWMKDCLQDEKLIEQDSKYLVEKVRYKGQVYDTVVQWSRAMAKSELPFLYECFVALVMTEYADVSLLHQIVINQGGTFCDAFPLKNQYRIGSHPFLHADIPPLFLIHDGKHPLEVYQNDPDKMYKTFTVEEFFHFMLKREIKRDTSENPQSVFLI